MPYLYPISFYPLEHLMPEGGDLYNLARAERIDL